MLAKTDNRKFDSDIKKNNKKLIRMINNSEAFVRIRRRCNSGHQPLAHAGFVLTLLFSVLAVFVNGQTDMINYCGIKPCIEPLRISCEEMIELYQFQGSCCSMESIPATGGCRITVSSGNCFWYPWCGTCEEDEEVKSRCNNIFETDARQQCPMRDFDPLAIQASADFDAPSCAPSMMPSDVSLDKSAGAVPTAAVVMGGSHWSVRAATTGAVAVLVTGIAVAVAAV